MQIGLIKHYTFHAILSCKIIKITRISTWLLGSMSAVWTSPKNILQSVHMSAVGSCVEYTKCWNLLIEANKLILFNQVYKTFKTHKCEEKKMLKLLKVALCLTSWNSLLWYTHSYLAQSYDTYILCHLDMVKLSCIHVLLYSFICTLT